MKFELIGLKFKLIIIDLALFVNRALVLASLSERDYYTNIGWWRVHCTVYGTKKSDNERGEAESIIAFLRPVNCIVDELPSNICYIIHIGKILPMLKNAGL